MEDTKRQAENVTKLANYSTAIHFAKKRGTNGQTSIDVRIDSKISGEETGFTLAVELGDSPDKGKKEVRQIKWTPQHGPTKGQLVKKVFEEQGLDAKTKDVVELVNARLQGRGTVTPKYVNVIKKQLKKEES